MPMPLQPGAEKNITRRNKKKGIFHWVYQAVKIISRLRCYVISFIESRNRLSTRNPRHDYFILMTPI
ncbi:hypothetical protein CMR03_16190 [Pantoea allii]|nr:hypothetical protein CMR03_16190 [Pantoea allii]